MKNILAVLVMAGIAGSGAAFAAQTSQAKFKKRFSEARPYWGVQVNVSGGSGFGGHDVTLTQKSVMTGSRAISLHTEYQPVHDFGILGFGPTVSYYIPGDVKTNADTPHADLRRMWTVGGQIRYQGKYWENQVIVPVGAYTAQMLDYLLDPQGQGNFFVHGPVFGAWLDMGAIDRKTAQNAFVSSGISRFYATLEARSLTGNDFQFRMESDLTYHLGFRFEF